MSIDDFAPHRFCVAPMIDWTTLHCRFFHRLMTRRALLYTEMIVDQAVLRGDRDRLLGFSPEEHPVALQLGGSDPAALAEAVRIACGYGYDEINLNVGCPSDRVQSGTFGACLMRDPAQVARCMTAMIAASEAEGGPEITVKCRIGVDDQDPEIALRDFVRAVSGAGVRRFAIHARKAWLKGLSPKENRSIPPLDYDLALAIKRENPGLAIVLNGGVETLEAAQAHLAAGFDGVMLGRAAYHDPLGALAPVDRVIFGVDTPDPDPVAVVREMVDYATVMGARGVPLNAITRHMLGLFSGRRGAKAWRRTLSDRAHRDDARPELLLEALEMVLDPV